MTATEGVIKFHLEYEEAPALPEEQLIELLIWHRKLHALGLVGCDPGRYDGLAYGNLSQRHESAGFVISGTQTGGVANPGPGHFTWVRSWDIDNNSVFASGPLPPSSESLTHGILYSLLPGTNAVFHVHSPEIWLHRQALELPATDPKVEYGTPAMAREIGRLVEDTDAGAEGIFAMAGHRDGIVSYGVSADTTGQLLLRTYHAACACQ